MGGMQVLQWVASYPDRVRAPFPLPQRLSIRLSRSPSMRWLAPVHHGRPGLAQRELLCTGQPEKGLAVARMIGHITFMSDLSMEEKFSRKLKTGRFSFGFDADFEVEGYLRYRGANFVKRFDANSYLYITKAMDYFDLSGGRLLPKGKSADLPRFLVISFQSDWLYPSYQSADIVRALKTRHADATYCELKSTYGHDAFLVEMENQTKLISPFLDKTFNGYEVSENYEH